MNSHYVEEFAKLPITSFKELMEKATTYEKARAIAESELQSTTNISSPQHIHKP